MKKTKKVKKNLHKKPIVQKSVFTQTVRRLSKNRFMIAAEYRM